ncbi:MAG TPA: hypothetical protein VE173_10695, partial [Longimicrobiales bacterium]|nr:hypothetical protein [Longimicrobiales bacterium]
MTDTIAALSTPPGVGAVALVRVSGSDAFGVLRRIVPDLDGLPEPRRARLVRIHDPLGGGPVDRALVTCFPGPGSYTGEDVVEISGHGGWLTPTLV